MDIKQYLSKRDFEIYEKIVCRNKIKAEKRILIKELDVLNKELSKYTDVKIWKRYNISKERVRQLRKNLWIKCKRLWIEFKI